MDERKDAETALSAWDYNDLLFERFYADLERGTLTAVPEPTAEERAACLARREESLERLGPDASPGLRAARSTKLLLINEEIPIEVVLRAEKTLDTYFKDLKSVLGLTHQYQRAKQRLYQHYGYQWYTQRDIYPGLLID